MVSSVSSSLRRIFYTIIVLLFLFATAKGALAATTTWKSNNDIQWQAFDVLTETSFVILYCDLTAAKYAFSVYNTSGTIIGSEVILESSGALCSHELDVTAFDEDEIGVAIISNGWVNFTSYYINGTPIGSVDAFDYAGSGTIAVDTLNDTDNVVIAYFDTGDDDVTYAIYNKNGTQVKAPTDVDTQAGSNSQGVDVLGWEDSFAVAWVDDNIENVSLATFNISGAAIMPIKSIATVTGNYPKLSVSTVSLAHTDFVSEFVMLYQDGVEFDTSFVIYDRNGTEKVGITDVDTNSGNYYAKVDVASINGTNDFAVAWHDDTDNDLTFGTYDTTGASLSGDVDVKTDQTTNIRAGMSVVSRNHFASLCGGDKMVVGWTPDQVSAIFGTYNDDGTAWSGICGDNPVVSTPSIPSSAFTITNITSNSTYRDSSLNGNITFKLYVNGTFIIDQNFTNQTSGTTLNSTFGSGNFSKNNIINVSVQAWNSQGNTSGIVWSSQLTISNSVPTVPTLTAEADTHTNTTVELVWSASTDDDSDSITYDIRIGTSDGAYDLGNWTGVSDTNQTTDTNLTDWDSAFYWAVRSYDSTNYSDWTSSDDFSRTNAPPTFILVNSSANDGFLNRTNATLRVDYSCSDSDSDTCNTYTSYKWFNDSGVIAGQTGQTLPNTAFFRYENITAEVTIEDDSGAPDNQSIENASSIYIQNSPPAFIDINISSNDNNLNRTNATFTLNYACSDSDSDTCNTYIGYKWYNDSGVISGQTGNTLTSAYFVKNDNITGEVWIEDNSGASNNQTIQNSSTVTIQNSPPLNNFTTSLTPTTAYTNDTLTIANTTAIYDEDGDALVLTYKWFNDTSVITGQTTTTLASTFFVRAENITAEITASDGSTIAKNTTRTISNSVVFWNDTIASVSYFHVQNMSIQLNATDTDEEGLTWADNSSLFAISVTGLISDNPVQSDHGNHSIQINVTDNITAITMNFTYEVIDRNPTITSVAINETSPVPSTNLTCIPTGEADADGDTMVYNYDWLKADVSQGINNSVLGSGNTSANENWKCTLYMNDGLLNSSVVTSSSVSIDTGFVAPTINYTNATTATTLITSDSTNPTNNNSWVNLSVTFDDTNSGERHTAFFCKTDSATTGGCGGDEFCRSTINTTDAPTLTCNYTVSPESSSSITYYVFVADNESLISASTSSTFDVNHPPVRPSLTAPTNGTWITLNHTLIEFNTTDQNSDTISYHVYADNTTDPSAEINVTTGVNFHWLTLNETTYYVKILANDSHGYESDMSGIIYFRVDTIAPNLANSTISEILYTDETVSIGVDCADANSGVNTTTVDINITNAINVTTTESMSLIAGSYEATYVPLGQAGSYELDTFRCTDLAGNLGTSSTNFNFTTSVRPGGGDAGGGGAAGQVEIQSIINFTNVTGPVCGNFKCEDGETPANCISDCQVNIDRFIYCIWDDEINCLYTETWFVTFIIILVVTVSILLSYQAERKSMKKRRKRKKNVKRKR